MTDADWQQAAEAFGVTPEELPHYRDAFREIEQLGIDAFADLLLSELLSARSAVPVASDILRRLEIRRAVLVEVFGFVGMLENERTH